MKEGWHLRATVLWSFRSCVYDVVCGYISFSLKCLAFISYYYVVQWKHEKGIRGGIKITHLDYFVMYLNLKMA